MATKKSTSSDRFISKGSDFVILDRPRVQPVKATKKKATKTTKKRG